MQPLRDAGRADALPIAFRQVGYGVGTTRILDAIDLDLAAGGPTVLLGPNGCGKTTLLRLAAGLLAPSTGAITFAGQAECPGGARAIVLQKPVMLRRSAAANIAFALAAAGRPASPSDIARLLELANISALALRPARRLSGGEQQRLALARALAREPQVLFLDEPTASLDPAATKLVEEIVARVAASGVKVVMATHDLSQARRLATTIVFLAGGRILEHAPADAFFTGPTSLQARRFLAGELII